MNLVLAARRASILGPPPSLGAGPCFPMHKRRVPWDSCYRHFFLDPLP